MTNSKKITKGCSPSGVIVLERDDEGNVVKYKKETNLEEWYFDGEHNLIEHWYKQYIEEFSEWGWKRNSNINQYIEEFSEWGWKRNSNINGGKDGKR